MTKREEQEFRQRVRKLSYRERCILQAELEKTRDLCGKVAVSAAMEDYPSIERKIRILNRYLLG